jgi:chromosome partitioning protein
VGCGVNARELEISALDVLQAERSIPEAMVRIETLNLDVLPSNSDLTAAEVSLLQVDNREYRLRDAIEKIAQQYAWIIIDCPPSLNMLTLNALTAANSVLIPMQCEYYALEGLASLLTTIDQVRGSVNPGLHVEGLLRTMYDARNNLSGAVSEQLIEHFGDRVYRTLIPRNVTVAEAPSYGLPVLRYAPSSKGALAYLGLAGEMLRRNRKRQAG